MPNPSELQAKLKLLRDSYATQLPEKIAQLDLTWKRLSQTEWDEAGFQNLYRMAHSLSGSGQTFGFSALSATARAMENFLKPIGELKQVLNDDQLEQVMRFLDELRHASMQRDSVFAEQSGLVAHYNQSPHIARHVFVVEDDQALAEELKVQLSYFDYDVSLFNNLKDFREAIQENSKVVVLMDVNFPEDSRGGVNIMNDLQQGRDVLIPVIFLSAYGDMDIRLDAVRAGAWPICSSR